jgi:DMSO/TMAO reductase YedYZ heme-binding membrane subunit
MTDQLAIPPAEEPARPRTGKNVVDVWMEQSLRFGGSVISRKTVALILLGIPALMPVVFMSRAIIDANQNTLGGAEADVLGAGSMALLILILTVSPMVTWTGQRWFIPLRNWYLIMLAVSATTDGILAAVDEGFPGGILGNLAGHLFQLVGSVMVVIIVPVALLSNKRVQRWLGKDKDWETLQKLTYVVWGLLFAHLALLQGLGPSPERGDGTPIMHQRVYQLAACSLPLLLLRLPLVRRWVEQMHNQGRQWVVNLTMLPLAALYIVAFSYIVNEEIFYGVGALRLQPNLI